MDLERTKDPCLQHLFRELGKSLHIDVGDMQTYAKAVSLAFQRSLFETWDRADKGDPESCLEIADYYGQKGCFPEDPQRVFELVKKACDAGSPKAFFRLGNLYLEGYGVKKDRKKAIELFAEGAKLGDKDCEEKLRLLETERADESQAGMPNILEEDKGEGVHEEDELEEERGFVPLTGLGEKESLREVFVPEEGHHSYAQGLHGLPTDDGVDKEKDEKRYLLFGGILFVVVFLGLSYLFVNLFFFGENQEVVSDISESVFERDITEIYESQEAKLSEIERDDDIPTKEVGLDERKLSYVKQKETFGKSTLTYVPTRGERARAAWRLCRQMLTVFRPLEARDACERAVVLNPLLIMARVDLGWVLLELGETDMAIKIGREAFEMTGKGNERRAILILISAGLTVQGRYKEAIEALNQAQKFEDGNDDCEDRLLMLTERVLTESLAVSAYPGFLCYMKKGETEANRYLVRKGIVDPNLFMKQIQDLPTSIIENLKEKSRMLCPW